MGESRLIEDSKENISNTPKIEENGLEWIIVLGLRGSKHGWKVRRKERKGGLRFVLGLFVNSASFKLVKLLDFKRLENQVIRNYFLPM